MSTPNETINHSMQDETRWPCHPPLIADEYKHLDPADVVKLSNLWVVTCGRKAGIYTDMYTASESIRQKEGGSVAYASTWWKAIALWNAHCKAEHRHITVCSNRTQISTPSEQTSTPSCYYVLCYDGERKIMMNWDETCFRFRNAVRQGHNPSVSVFRSMQEVIDVLY